MIHISNQFIQEMTDKIVKEIHPQMIVLFGSYAKGTARPDSDLDFLIVEDGPFDAQRSRRAETTKLWKLFFDCRVPLDFLVYTPEEVQKWQSSRNHVVAHAMKEGKVLYERR